MVTSDRAKSYLWVWRHQWCWAHLKRDFEKMAARPGEAGQIGQRLLSCTHQLFHDWHRARDGDLTPRGFLRHTSLLSKQIQEIVEEGTACAQTATAATCRELLNGYDNLWLFRDVTDVEPTNNAAERALRHGVIWKHLSFGTQSAAGSRFVETLLTVIETCRQQNRNAFEFITETLKARLNNEPTPSLLTGV